MIITSLIDTDLYKFTMMQAVLHQFPAAEVEYQFRCRTEGVDLRPYAKQIEAEIHHLCQLRFTEDELAYLGSLRFVKPDFIHFLRLFQLDPRFIDIKADDAFSLTIKGPWLHTILFEVPLLAIVSEVYFRETQPTPDLSRGKQRLADVIDQLKTQAPAGEFKFSDFGTRRRFSKDWHRYVIETFKAELPKHLSGTSNVFFAKAFNLTPIGTMAHEYIQASQALGPRLIDSQKFAFEAWAREYRGDLGIALSDVYDVDAFLRDFDMYFCKLFDGARHDSGDPYAWGEKVVAHYEKNRVDPKTKTLVFSDSLSLNSALALFNHFKSRSLLAFGIGTKLTNDLGYQPLQIVIKMTECNGQPVAKLSDSPDKTMCKDPSYLAYLKQVFQITS